MSWILGMILNSILARTQYYEKLSHLNFMTNPRLNSLIGLDAFKWIVKNTPFKFFNPKLNLKAKAGMTELDNLRKEMTFAEVSHLIAFIAVSVFPIIKIANAEFLPALAMMIPNILLNLYPSLLQQQNKRRIDRFKAIMVRRNQSR